MRVQIVICQMSHMDRTVIGFVIGRSRSQKHSVLGDSTLHQSTTVTSVHLACRNTLHVKLLT